MLLNVIADDQSVDLDVPPALLTEARDFFDRMDGDMDAGWQMGREWIERPDHHQRCQIAADKLLTALENQNRKLAMMMAAYILARLENVSGVDIDTTGEMLGTQFIIADAPAQARSQAPAAQSEGAMTKMEALEQAGKDVTKIFKVGRNFRFSVYDHANGQWNDSAPVADKQEAETLRQQAFKQRFDELQGGAGD
jgi:hypothetical protein